MVWQSVSQLSWRFWALTFLEKKKLASILTTTTWPWFDDCQKLHDLYILLSRFSCQQYNHDGATGLSVSLSVHVWISGQKIFCDKSNFVKRSWLLRLLKFCFYPLNLNWNMRITILILIQTCTQSKFVPCLV